MRQDTAMLALGIVIALASVVALPLNLGGVLAASVSLGIACFRLTTAQSLTAVAIAAVIVWFGLQDADYDRPEIDQKLRWQEWLAAITTTGLAAFQTFAIFGLLLDYAASVSVGICAGTLGIVGSQVRSSNDLSFKQAVPIFGGIAGIGILIGGIYGALTYFVPRYAFG